MYPHPPHVHPRAGHRHSRAQQTVMVAWDGGVEGVDLLIEAFPQAPVGIADHK
jgi:hypothetical protein